LNAQIPSENEWKSTGFARYGMAVIYFGKAYSRAACSRPRRTLLLLLAALVISGCNPFKSSKSDALERITKAGGLCKINLEAKTIFSRFRTNQVKAIIPHMLG